MTFKHISADELKQLMNGGEVQLIDIRDPGSYEAGHIENAQHVGDHNIADFIAAADKSKPTVVCCYHGNSSQSAAAYLAEQGFEDAYSLDGGFAGWH